MFKQNKRNFANIFCCKWTEQKNREKSDSIRSSLSSGSSNMEDESAVFCGEDREFCDSLNSFLTSSLNIELVYTILKGIQSISKYDKLDKEALEACKKTGKCPTADIVDYSGGDNEIKMTFSSIRITNSNFWESAQQEQFTVHSSNVPFESIVEEQLKKNAEDESTIELNKKVTVTGLFPESFANLRERDGIGIQTISTSLDPSSNAHNVFKAGEASGASGSFFFFSTDKKFIVKTMTDSEMEFFLTKFGRPYFNHVKRYPTSLLARIYGIYRVKIAGLAQVNLMLMGHTLQVGNQA